eukprot:CAMPEP_0205951748 /NCGR_PEP_ID=MMETSP1459-20131121/3148_1 /ASSEMBLY_ACC=CAM_ASM_001120 /TAXON_ID=41880 /ORGANISM="Pycnococcus provasolii, Strain RCC931" /LENGTH=30 /DNA_ID= /DNA_START= /DNA_END= /DNA_ORIENTATION=
MTNGSQYWLSLPEPTQTKTRTSKEKADLTE